MGSDSRKARRERKERKKEEGEQHSFQSFDPATPEQDRFANRIIFMRYLDSETSLYRLVVISQKLSTWESKQLFNIPVGTQCHPVAILSRRRLGRRRKASSEVLLNKKSTFTRFYGKEI